MEYVAEIFHMVLYWWIPATMHFSKHIDFCFQNPTSKLLPIHIYLFIPVKDWNAKFNKESNRLRNIWKASDFPGGPVVKTLRCVVNAGEVGSIPGQGPKTPHATAQPRD